jgi:hypothetical protein
MLAHCEFNEHRVNIQNVCLINSIDTYMYVTPNNIDWCLATVNFEMLDPESGGIAFRMSL